LEIGAADDDWRGLKKPVELDGVGGILGKGVLLLCPGIKTPDRGPFSVRGSEPPGALIGGIVLVPRVFRKPADNVEACGREE
jgi:hypothetical protein